MQKFEEILIDGDLLVFSSVAAIEYNSEEPKLQECLNNIEKRVRNIVDRLGGGTFRLFFTDKENFRYKVLPGYKKNRIGKWKPPSLDAALKLTKETLFGESERGLEADDLLRKYQKFDGSTVCVTIDKDIPQFGGWHYRWETQHQGEKLWEVDTMGSLRKIVKERASGTKTEIKGDGIRFFCWQLLVGDPTDGIIGCGVTEKRVYKTGKKAGQEYERRIGVGAVEAYDLLEHALTYNKMMGIIIAQYKKRFGDDWEHYLLMYGRALFMVAKTECDGRYLQLWHYRGDKLADSWYDIETGTVGAMRG